MNVVILGCGYTGERVAKRLAARGIQTLATHRASFDVTKPPLRLEIPEGARVLHSIPLVEGKRPTPLLLPLLKRASRVVYLSTTSVYGATEKVNENTPVKPRFERERLRVEEERDLASGAWQTLILRPAAIYGPERGIHVAMREGKHKIWGDGQNYVSRIHVEDLAEIAVAALSSELTGAFPVADEEPCRAIEIARFCAERFALPMPEMRGELAVEDTRRANRQVDGRAILRELGVRLAYPNYRVGLGW